MRITDMKHYPMSKLSSHIIVFSKAQIASLLSTTLDFCLTYLLMQLSVFYMVSTAIGTVVGGAANFMMNYLWAFSAKGLPYSRVAPRYIGVWIGSFLLNLWGTYGVTNLFQNYLPHWANYQEEYVILAKMITAVTVAIGWNYLLHRYYVFRRGNNECIVNAKNKRERC